MQNGAVSTGTVRPDLLDYCSASNLALNEQIHDMKKSGRKLYHMAFGQSPFPVMPEAIKALQDNADKNAYLPVSGIAELKEAICQFHKYYDKLHFRSSQVIVGPGSKELIFLLMNVFNGDILVASPSWTTYTPQIQLAHNKAIVIEKFIDEDWLLSPSALLEVTKKLDKSRNKLLIFCNPDNPTGVTYTTAQLKNLGRVCRENNILVLSDEIYGRLQFDGQHDSIARYYPEGTILSSGLSKWASAGGWRLGYNIYPPELKELYNAVHSAASHTYSCASAPVQYAASIFMQNLSACDEYIQHTRRILEAVSLYCTRELRSVGVTIIPSSAGYYIFPNFENLRGPLKKRGITKCTDFCKVLLDEVSVALMSGGPAFLRPANEFTTRLCYVNFDGAKTLDASRKIGLEFPLPEDFVKNECCGTYLGIQALKKWILDLCNGMP